jgi:tartrate-resistant acid phosphatase type 5
MARSTNRWILAPAFAFTVALSLTACAPSPTASAPVTGAGAGSASTSTAVAATSTAPAAEATTAPDASAVTTFAVIGDYGTADSHERAVARVVASWHPSYILAVGDDYYSPAGGTGTGKDDDSTGAFYGAWLKDIHTTGHHLPKGLAAINAFFPALGNHDYSDATPSPRTYLTYFTLPGAGFRSTSGNERYYDYVEGPVHFFVLNSNTAEPDGTSSTSKQARWLKAQLAASTSTWNVVYDHHPPYSSDNVHHSTRYMQWPFAAWGADVVISGHAHVYERLARNGIVYFIDGLGGAARYAFGKAIAGSKVRYRANWGAQRVVATDTSLTFQFISVSGATIDRYTLTAP